MVLDNIQWLLHYIREYSMTDLPFQNTVTHGMYNSFRLSYLPRQQL